MFHSIFGVQLGAMEGIATPQSNNLHRHQIVGTLVTLIWDFKHSMDALIYYSWDCVSASLGHQACSHQIDSGKASDCSLTLLDLVCSYNLRFKDVTKYKDVLQNYKISFCNWIGSAVAVAQDSKQPGARRWEIKCTWCQKMGRGGLDCRRATRSKMLERNT